MHHQESNSTTWKSSLLQISRASLTVRILRYEVEKGLKQSAPDGLNWDPAKKATLCSKSDLSNKNISTIKLREGWHSSCGMQMKLFEFRVPRNLQPVLSWNLRLAPCCFVWGLTIQVWTTLKFELIKSWNLPFNFSSVFLQTEMCLAKWVVCMQKVNVYRVEAGKPPSPVITRANVIKLQQQNCEYKSSKSRRGNEESLNLQASRKEAKKNQLSWIVPLFVSLNLQANLLLTKDSKQERVDKA